MQIRNVLRTYTLLRQLSDDESALLETLRQLSESEREQLVESLSPGRTTSKKSAKKSSSKSSRASGMAAAIKKSLESQKRVTAESDSDPNAHCQKEFEGGFVCDEPADANVHHLRGATGYHEFIGPQVKAMAASTSTEPTPAPSGEVDAKSL